MPTTVTWSADYTIPVPTDLCHVTSDPVAAGNISATVKSSVPWNNIWAAAWQIQQNDICAQRRLRSACASTQSDQSLHYVLKR